MKAETIWTKELLESLKQFMWVDEQGKTKISLGNSRLDFKKDYFLDKFTDKGVRLYWINGDHRVYCMGKVEFNEQYKEYAFYTEGWSYIEHLRVGGNDGKN